MASVIKLSYHRRLFLVLLAFSWLMTCLVAAFQYVREREYKSDFISAQLQLYNRYLLDTVEQGEDYQRYIATHSRPFEDLRVSVITLSGTVVYDNELDSDSLDNHRSRPKWQRR